MYTEYTIPQILTSERGRQYIITKILKRRRRKNGTVNIFLERKCFSVKNPKRKVIFQANQLERRPEKDQKSK